MQRLLKLRPLIVLARLDLNVLGDELPLTTIEEVIDGGALCLEAKAAFALFGSRNPAVADEFPDFRAPLSNPLTNVRPFYKVFLAYTSIVFAAHRCPK
jgi:hypothetical protein